MAKVIPYKETLHGPERVDPTTMFWDLSTVPRVGETMLIPAQLPYREDESVLTVTRVVHNFGTGSVMVIGRDLSS
jgi:hypothetical protein